MQTIWSDITQRVPGKTETWSRAAQSYTAALLFRSRVILIVLVVVDVLQFGGVPSITP